MSYVPKCSSYLFFFGAGNTLIALFGYNRAWQYFGPQAYFNQTIQLKLWWVWLIFGAIAEVSFRIALEPLLEGASIFTL